MPPYRLLPVTLPMAVALVLVLPRTGHTCDCVRLKALSTDVRNETPFIFSGKVVEIVERNEHTTTIFDGGATTSVKPLERRVIFEVAAGWRGVSRERVSVIAQQDDCMFPFEIGGQYLVFANRDAQGRAWTGICTRTAPVTSAAETIRLLGAPSYRRGGEAGGK